MDGYRAYVRAFQFCFNIGARCLPWRRAERVEGVGALSRVPALLQSLRVTKPLLVGSPSFVRTGIARSLCRSLDEISMPYAVYSGVRSDPTVSAVEALVSLYYAEGCDGIVAVGGGSPMDAAKAMAARLARPQKNVLALTGLLKVRRKTPPLIAVPTTAGTGSETTIAAVITDDTTHHKAAIMDLCLIPRYAVLDPSLCTGVPPEVTAMTGMDALTHAVEAYLCWTYNTKESLHCAEEAVRLIFQNLLHAYRNGDDLAARANMLEAAYLAGFAFTRAGVGYVHAIAHAVGGLYGVPHGMANAVLLPVVLEDYGAAVHKKLARLAAIAGVGCDLEEDAARAAALIAAIRDLNARMGIPDALDCIREADMPQMVRWALAEANPVYPVPVLYGTERCRAVIERAARRSER